METKDQWANYLRALREDGDATVLSIVCNIPVSFSPDNIILNIQSRTKLELVEKYRSKLPLNIELRFHEKTATAITTEEKLEKLFGDRLELV